uniref:Rab9 effector protein with kelch motifs n=1 Tax=Astyanax mexicanus TaxID=7994 RepID=A0A8B9JEA2_ASTMX
MSLGHLHPMWDVPEWEGLQARYEHCSFVPETDPESVWVFAGAEQSGNRNCIQVLHTTVEVKGMPPSPRTYHTSSACVGDRLFVFSGGDTGATPVTDPQVHVFNTGVSVTSLYCFINVHCSCGYSNFRTKKGVIVRLTKLFL